MGRVEFPQLHDPEWLQREYVLLHRSASYIAQQVGCSRQNVHKAVRRYGLNHPELRDPEWLSGRTADQVALELGCSRTAALTALWRNSKTETDPWMT